MTATKSYQKHGSNQSAFNIIENFQLKITKNNCAVNKFSPHKPRKMKSNNNKTGHKTTEVKATIPVRSPVKVMNLSADTATITQDVRNTKLTARSHCYPIS